MENGCYQLSGQEIPNYKIMLGLCYRDWDLRPEFEKGNWTQ